MNRRMLPLRKKLSALLGLPACSDRLHGGLHVAEFAEKNEESARGKQGSHAVPDRGEHDASGDRLKSAYDTDNGLEAVAADMGHGGQVDDQMSGSVVHRGFHQLIQFSSDFLVNVALGTKDGNRSVAFNGYRHGDVISMACDDRRHTLMKVCTNSI